MSRASLNVLQSSVRQNINLVFFDSTRFTIDDDIDYYYYYYLLNGKHWKTPLRHEAKISRYRKWHRNYVVDGFDMILFWINFVQMKRSIRSILANGLDQVESNDERKATFIFCWTCSLLFRRKSYWIVYWRIFFRSWLKISSRWDAYRTSDVYCVRCTVYAATVAESKWTRKWPIELEKLSLSLSVCLGLLMSARANFIELVFQRCISMQKNKRNQQRENWFRNCVGFGY